MTEVAPAVIQDLRDHLSGIQDAVAEALEALGPEGAVADLDKFHSAQAKADHLLREMLAIQDR